jgi:hypothetical protein
MCVCVKGIWTGETESHLGEDGKIRVGDVDWRLELQPLELRACVDGFCFVLCALNADHRRCAPRMFVSLRDPSLAHFSPHTHRIHNCFITLPLSLAFNHSVILSKLCWRNFAFAPAPAPRALRSSSRLIRPCPSPARVRARS